MKLRLDEFTIKNIVEMKTLNPNVREESSNARSCCPVKSCIGVSLRVPKKNGSERCMAYRINLD